MERNIIGSRWDRDNRNGLNDNFAYLFQGHEAVQDTAESYLEVLNNSLEQYQRDSVTPIFELGGWSTGGAKVTTDTPMNIRSVTPYYLRKGMMISTDPYGNYEYDLIIRGTDVPGDGSYIKRNGYQVFGENHTIESGNYYYIIIRRTDGKTMTSADVGSASSRFNDIVLNYNNLVDSIGTDEVAQTLISVGLPISKAKFELGGWNIYGNKVTTDNPINIRSAEMHFLKKDSIIKPKKSNLYKYEFLIRSSKSHGEDFLVGRTGYIDFGSEYRVEQDNFHCLVVARKDGNVMTENDIESISNLFGFYTLDENSNHSYNNGVSNFDIVGEMKEVMTSEIYNFISDPDGGITPQQFHDMTIDLVNAHSELTDYELHGQDAYGYNMYSYEIKPHVMRNSPDWNTTPTGSIGTPLEIPKIIITGGIHGSERNANYVLHYFMNELLNNPDNIETFDTLAQNVHFVFMPMCNPSGFVDNTYNNRANMNLNRDFGPHGNFEQPETQYVKALMDKHSNADLHIDYHNFTPQTGKLDILGYALTDVDELKRLTTNAYKYVGRQMQLKDTRYPQSRTHQWAYTADANVGTVGRYSNSAHGIPSSIVESPKWQLFFDEVDHGKTVTQLGVDVLSNVIISFMNARK